MPKEIVAPTLPVQEKFFSTEKLRRSARAGTNLPDPTMVPYGYDPKGHYRHLFPALELPALFPPASHHPDDHVSFGSPTLEPHQLYLGDNLYVLRQLPTESIDLIYIDPPFFSNRTYTQIWGDDNEVRSFTDIFQDGMFSYLAWLNARLWEMKRVLKSTGSIYVHCDWHASHYIKCEMDKIFGYDNFLNEIIVHYTAVGLKAKSYKFHQNTEPLFSYAKNRGGHCWNDVVIPANLRRASKHVFNSETGKAERVRNSEGKIEYFDIAEQKADNFIEVPALRGEQKIGYPTQKNELIIERIIKASSNTGDVVADFFMGGGTTGAVAVTSGRRFIGCDISRVAVSVTASPTYAV